MGVGDAVRTENEMKMKAVQFTVSAVVFLAAMAAVSSPAALPEPILTYQGELSEAGGPASGVYDLQFRLFDAAVGGSELGAVSHDDMVVTDGRLTAELDYGDSFDGRELWLEIRVRPGASSGAHTVLTPRQPMTAAPYVRFAADAGFASIADSALTAGDADTLDGQHGAYYLSWSNRTGVPTDLADGDDDVLGDLVCTTGEVATWSGSAWVCDSDDGARFLRTVVVPGTINSLVNGSALIAAVEAVPEPTSQEEAWKVFLEPGVYDLGGARLDLIPWMLLEGAGQGTTVITSAYCGPVAIAVGVVTGADFAEIRDLSVENTCTSATERKAAISFDLNDEGGRLTRVTARAIDNAARCSAVSMRGDNAVLERVTAEASGCPTSNTAINSAGNGALILDCVAEATGGGVHHALNVSGVSRIMRGSYTSDDDPHSGDSAIKVSSDAELFDVTTNSDGLALNVVAFENIIVTASRMDIHGQVEAYAGSGYSLGLVIEHSRIDSAGTTIEGEAGAVIRIAATQLAGGSVSPDGALLTCAGVWDESWIFHPNTCP